MNKGIIEAQDLPEGEKVYLKKDFMGWRVVEPNTRWYHYVFGGKKNLYILILILILVAILYLGIQNLISSYKYIAANPCSFCSNFTKPLNLSSLNNFSIRLT